MAENGEAAAVHRISFTFPDERSSVVSIEATGVGDSQLYLVAWLADAMAREFRAAMLARQAAASITPVRAFPGPDPLARVGRRS